MNVTVAEFLSIIKQFDCIYVESLLIESHCIFENADIDVFLWLSPDSKIFVKFYRKNNLDIEYDKTKKCFYIKAEYGTSFRINPMGFRKEID